jgi:low affinity Fe/Cu permease
VRGRQRNSGLFDRFAAAVGGQASRPWFFTVCVLAVLVWAITGPIFAFNETWQLIINTGTTIVTFLMVALLQNTQDRSTRAMNEKLDALIEAVALILEDTSVNDDNDNGNICIKRLRSIVGVEMEGS